MKSETVLTTLLEVAAATGERINVVAIADRADVTSHPAGKVAYTR